MQNTVDVPTPAPQPQPTLSAWPGERYPQTRTRLLSDADVAGWSFAETRYAINEMYARHGYDFKNPSVKRKFSDMGWYRRARVSGRSQAQAEQAFSSMEQANRRLLVTHRDGFSSGHGE